MIHIRWEWTIACFLRCPVHGTPLSHRCGTRQEPDPLVFSGFASEPARHCGSCGADLTDGDDYGENPGTDREMVLTVESAYREALLGTAPDPVLLGATTARASRQFVEDLLTLLTGSLNPNAVVSPRHCSRQDVLHIITALIRNALSSADPSLRHQRYRRGLTLWSSLLAVLPTHIGAQFEEVSRRWPLTLRRRFTAGLRWRIRKRWPYQPYCPAKDRERRTERCELAAVHRLPPRTLLGQG